MRLTIAAALAVFVGCSVTSVAKAEAARTCKECSDFRKRCMANYPGPTCNADYDICMKNCGRR
jgi:hypothetical protein